MPLKNQKSPSGEERHPIVAGLVALASVAVVLGLLAGAFVFLATGVLGLGGGSDPDAQVADDGASLYLPTPQATQSSDGPLITLSSVPTESSDSESSDLSTETPAQEATSISLSVGQTSVAAMERIDLTGVYTGGEGAVLQVQRFENDDWVDFPVTVGVSGEQFSTYVQTGRSGVQKWRVKDTDTGLTSNEVSVTVG
ncbi:MAG: hypothetical protein QM572_12975 [Nocardioides sp.]|uniref:hypothetical protein n=1 Tax=Nocardioides sp. TaxID=35761 RepID=UPI0039E495A4